MWRDIHLTNMHLRNRFYPDSLPDSRGSRVEALRITVPSGLLAARLPIMATVTSANRQCKVCLIFQGIGDVDFKGCKSSSMSHNFGVVYPYGCIVIDCAKMEDEMLVAPFCGDFDPTSIPYSFVEVRVAYAGHFAFRDEWHSDGV